MFISVCNRFLLVVVVAFFALAPPARSMEKIDPAAAPIDISDRLENAEIDLADQAVLLPLAFNGALPGMVTTLPGDFCDRCVVNPEAQVDEYLVPDPNYVMGYCSGRDGCSVWAPHDGQYLNHRQGIQRMNRNSKNYLIVSNSTLFPVWAGFEVIEIGSKSGTAHELYKNLPQPGDCPPCSDRIIRYEQRKC
jgi:hypothetical protein